MTLGQSIREFRDLHVKAKRGVLPSPEVERYHAYRDQLAALLLSAHRASLPAGQRPRKALRVARAVPAEIEFNDGVVRAMTLQLSSGGFGALLPPASAPHVGEEVSFALRMPLGQPVRGAARIVAVKEQAGASTVSFQFLRLDEPEAERVEMFVFDGILEHFHGV